MSYICFGKNFNFDNRSLFFTVILRVLNMKKYDNKIIDDAEVSSCPVILTSGGKQGWAIL
jgi:hypothetical protein